MTVKIDKDQVAAILDEIGTMLEIKGENPFKCGAYHNAARAVAAYPGSLESLIASGDIKRIKGIGTSIAEKIMELATTGKLQYYLDLKKEIPEGLLEMVAIPGFGPKRAKAVYEKLGIKSVGELEYACRENRLVDLPGFGAKLQEKILQGIEFLKKGLGRFLIDVAEKSALPLVDALKELPQVKRISLCGSIRRYKETIKDIDILVSTTGGEEAAAKIMDVYVSLPGIDHVEAKGDTKSTVVLTSGIDCDLRIVSDEQFPYALMYFTGSKEHNVEMRTRAKKLFDIKMNEYGLFQGKQEKFIKCKDEAEIFSALKLQYIPPEIREAMGEIAAAEQGLIPTLVEEKDLKGLIHVHTSWSDGLAETADYVEVCRRRGWQYVAICDHTKAAGYAKGLDEKRVKEQHKEIDQLNKKYAKDGIYIIKGTEVDILPDGSLDFDDNVLASFELVIASVHSKFNMTEKEMTQRILKALKNKYVNMLGHPTGRLLLAREGYPVNLEEVLDFCAKEGIIVELNAHPYRLDLDWHYIKKAIDMGIMISINPDSHSVLDVEHVRYGIGIARKGWATAKNILNCYPLKDVLQLLKRRRT